MQSPSTEEVGLTLPVSMRELREATSGYLIGKPVTLKGLAIDSREVREGDLFAAIKGSRVDGHEFAESALFAGAKGLLTEQALVGLEPQLVVPNVVKATAEFSRIKRSLFAGPVIGITGSAGKTTTKNLLSAALSEKGEVLATRGNQNNELGVPLTLARLSDNQKFAVIEMGAGKPGDIIELCDIAQPDVSVCLNALPAHLKAYENVAHIAETKGEIYRGLQNRGVAVINADQVWTPMWIEQAEKCRKITFGMSNEADFRASKVTYHGLGMTSFHLSAPGISTKVKLQLSGQHHVINALAALAVAIELGIDHEAAIDRIFSVRAESGRGDVYSNSSGIKIIDDTYNANPAAVKAAIDVLAREPAQKVFILGVMSELGEHSGKAHWEIGRYARDASIDCLLVVGELAKQAAEGFGSRSLFFHDQEALHNRFPDLHPKHTIWVKGSRLASLDRTVQWLVDREQASC